MISPAISFDHTKENGSLYRADFVVFILLPGHTEQQRRSISQSTNGGTGVSVYGGTNPARRSLTLFLPALMTVGHLRDILATLDPDLRVLIPAQEWGWADLARASSRTVTFAPIDERPDMGAWMTQRLDDPAAPRERCILLKPRPSRRRRPAA